MVPRAGGGTVTIPVADSPDVPAPRLQDPQLRSAGDEFAHAVPVEFPASSTDPGVLMLSRTAVEVVAQIRSVHRADRRVERAAPAEAAEGDVDAARQGGAGAGWGRPGRRGPAGRGGAFRRTDEVVVAVTVHVDGGAGGHGAG